MIAPFDDTERSRHEKNADCSGFLDRVIVEETKRSIAALEGFTPFRDVVYQLGILVHSIIEASNPLLSSSADAREEEYAADFLPRRSQDSGVLLKLARSL